MEFLTPGKLLFWGAAVLTIVSLVLAPMAFTALTALL